MNKGLFNGFRNSNPRDVFNDRGTIVSSAYNRRGVKDIDRVRFGWLNTASEPHFAPKYELIDGSSVSVRDTSFAVTNDTTLALVKFSGSSYTAKLTTDLKSWTTTGPSSLPAPSPIYLSNVIWTGEYFFVAGYSDTNTALYGYYTSDFSSWTRITIATGVTVGVGTLVVAASLNYVVLATRNDNLATVTYTLQKPITAPTVSTISSTYAISTVASLNLSTDVFMFGSFLTKNFSTYTQVIPAGGVVASTETTTTGGLLWCNYDNNIPISCYSRNGETWTTIRRAPYYGDYPKEIITPAGQLFISDYRALTPNGHMWFYDQHQYAEANWSGAPTLVRFKNELYLIPINLNHDIIKKLIFSSSQRQRSITTGRYLSRVYE